MKVVIEMQLGLLGQWNEMVQVVGNLFSLKAL
jgi:hypothetical protein